MGIEALRDLIPDFAKDIRLNLGAVVEQPELSPAARWGSALVAALACGEPTVIAHVTEDALPHLSSDEQGAVRSAAAIMAMNNVYYRFIHLSHDEALSAAPARLRMNVMRGHKADHELFELWSLVVSAVYGCGMCIESHLAQLRLKGMSNESILAGIRIGAVVHAVSRIVASSSS